MYIGNTGERAHRRRSLRGWRECVFKHALIFLRDFCDPVSGFKGFQVVGISDEHDFLELTCCNVLKTGYLFPGTDAAADDGFLFQRMKLVCRRGGFLFSSEHRFLLLVQDKVVLCFIIEPLIENFN